MQHTVMRNATASAGNTTPTHHQRQIDAHQPTEAAEHPPGLVDGKGSICDGGIQDLGRSKSLQGSCQVDPVLSSAPQLRGCTAGDITKVCTS